MMTIYGIPQCGSVKKAREWLDGHGLSYHFHDYKKNGVPETLLETWVATFGWDTVINRRGTTWRALPETVRAGMDAEGAKVAAIQNPSLIRRPILVTERTTLVGFDADQWQAVLS